MLPEAVPQGAGVAVELVPDLAGDGGQGTAPQVTPSPLVPVRGCGEQTVTWVLPLSHPAYISYRIHGLLHSTASLSLSPELINSLAIGAEAN